MMLGNHKQSSEILGNVSSENEKESQGSKPRVNYITTGKTASTIKSKISFTCGDINEEMFGNAVQKTFGNIPMACSSEKG